MFMLCHLGRTVLTRFSSKIAMNPAYRSFDRPYSLYTTLAASAAICSTATKVQGEVQVQVRLADCLSLDLQVGRPPPI